MKKNKRTKTTTETISIRKVDAAIRTRRTLIEDIERSLPLLKEVVRTTRDEIKKLDKLKKTTV